MRLVLRRPRCCGYLATASPTQPLYSLQTPAADPAVYKGVSGHARGAYIFPSPPSSTSSQTHTLCCLVDVLRKCRLVKLDVVKVALSVRTGGELHVTIHNAEPYPPVLVVGRHGVGVRPRAAVALQTAQAVVG